MNITLGHYLSLGAILFALSVIGIFLNPTKNRYGKVNSRYEVEGYKGSDSGWS